MTTKPPGFLGLILLGLALGSCSFFEKAPGSAVVVFYNHSGRNVLVEDNEVRTNGQGTFNYPTESGRPLIVFWNGCVHTYIAPDRKPGEFRSADWMLRDAYRVQLEPDGKLYLVPPSVEFPGDPAAMTQPAGFPLPPREGSSCLQ